MEKKRQIWWAIFYGQSLYYSWIGSSLNFPNKNFSSRKSLHYFQFLFEFNQRRNFRYNLRISVWILLIFCCLSYIKYFHIFCSVVPGESQYIIGNYQYKNQFKWSISVSKWKAEIKWNGGKVTFLNFHGTTDMLHREW